MVLFAKPIGLFVSLPLSPWLVSRFGSKQIVTVAALCYIVILVCLGSVGYTYQVAVVLFFFGLAGNMANISMNTQAVGVEALYQKPVMGSFHGLWSFAGFIGAGLGTLMIGWKVLPWKHFVVAFGISLLLLLLVYRNFLKSDRAVGERSRFFVMPDRHLFTLGVIAFCSLICEGTMFDWSGIYFEKVVKAPSALIGAGYTVFMCNMALSRFLSDYVTARLGFKRTLQISGLLITTGLMISVIFPYLYPAMAGFFLVGAGVSSVIPQVYSVAGKSRKFSTGAALTAVGSIGFLGFLIGPPLVGLLAGAFSLRVSFTVIAFIGLMVSVLVSRVNTE
jgi:MFS family permease